VATVRPSFFDELQARVSELFRASPAADIERNLKAVLAQAFQRLDLVTREEFDVQSELLAKLRDRVSELEQKVGRLEAQSRQNAG
jgi:ubiquinone biosynthesis accessory factor UbiK